MGRYGSLNDFWPYVAVATGVLFLVLAAVYRFGMGSRRRGAAWKYTTEIDQLRKLMREERYDEAAAMVAPLLRKNDITAEFFDVAAAIANKRGRPAEAARFWRAMQRHYPDEPWGHMRIARLLLRQGKVRQAHLVLERARRKVKQAAPLDTVLPEAAQAAGHWDEAIALWAKLRTTAPGDVNGYLQGRICLLAAGRQQEADALLADVAVRMPNNPAVKTALAAAEKAAKAAG